MFRALHPGGVSSRPRHILFESCARLQSVPTASRAGGDECRHSTHNERTMSTIEVSRAYTCPGQYLLIPAGLELEQLGVLPAGGYQLRVGALLDHPAFVQHEDAVG